MAIALDQNLGSAGGKNGSSWAFNTSATAAANTRIILAVSWFTSTVTVSSVSGGGLTWVIDKQSATDSGEMIAFVSADAPSGLASGTTITVTPSASISNSSAFLAAASFTGVQGGASGYLSGTPPAPDTTFSGTAWTTPSITTADANALLFAISANDGVTPMTSTTTGPATEIHDSHDAGSLQTITTAYRVATTATSYTIAGTWSATLGENRRGIVAYKESAAGGTAYVPRFRPLLMVGAWPIKLRWPFKAGQWQPAPASGAATLFGDSSASIVLTGTTFGGRKTFSTSTGTIVFTGTTLGSRKTFSTSTGTIVFTGTTVAARKAFGVSTGTIIFTGTTVAVRKRLGVSTATIVFTGTTVSKRTTRSTSSGTIVFTGTTAAYKKTFGVSSGTVVFTATTIGNVTGLLKLGASSATLTFTGTTVSRRKTFSVSTATVTFTGTTASARKTFSTSTGRVTLTATSAATAFGPLAVFLAPMRSSNRGSIRASGSGGVSSSSNGSLTSDEEGAVSSSVAGKIGADNV